MRFLIVLLLVVGLALTPACSCSPDPPVDPSNGPDDPETTQPLPPAQAGADLAVTFAMVYPATPTAGTAFRVEASVGNLGDAASGQYDVSAVVWDVSRDLTYPAGSATKGSMQPGEEWPVISSDMTVLDPGSYQLKVEVSPWDGDANDQNNTYIWAFTVQ